MNDREKKRNTPPPLISRIDTSSMSRHERRTDGIGFDEKIKTYLKENISVDKISDYGVYDKPKCVDYDVLIYISSFNRYDKLMRILNQLTTQKTLYRYKIFVMDDGSTEKKYKKIPQYYPNVLMLKNKINGGRALYWKTTNTIFSELKKYSSYAVIQIDDDFILCGGFIDIIMNKFFQLKKENNAYMGIRYHVSTCKENEAIELDNMKGGFNEKILFDGGSLFDVQFLNMFDYKLSEINPNIFKQKYQHSHVWTSLNDFVIKFGIMVYSFGMSLAWHDGNDESKMHGELRKTKKIYSKNFIDKIKNIV